MLRQGSNNTCKIEEDKENRNGSNVAQAEDEIWLCRTLETSTVGQLVVNNLTVENPTNIDRCEQSANEHEDIAGGIIHHVEDILVPQLDIVKRIKRERCQHCQGKG